MLFYINALVGCFFGATPPPSHACTRQVYELLTGAKKHSVFRKCVCGIQSMNSVTKWKMLQRTPEQVLNNMSPVTHNERVG